MSAGMCEYCDGMAELNLADLWLCPRHEAELEQQAGGMPALLELSPQARRALADTVFPRVIRQDIQEPSDIRER